MQTRNVAIPRKPDFSLLKIVNNKRTPSIQVGIVKGIVKAKSKLVGSYVII